MAKQAGLTDKLRKLANKLRKTELSKGVHYVYVAAKCDDPDPEQHKRNVEHASLVGLELANKGYVPFIPHVAIGKLVEFGVPRSRLLLLDLLWLMRCDAIFYANSSEGADREYNVAKALDIPVFWDIDQVPPSSDLDILQSFMQE